MTAWPVSVQAGELLVLEGGGSRLEVPVVEARTIFMHGTPSVEFLLDGEGQNAMAELTGGMVGETLAVSLCGRVLAEAVVRERIAGRGIVNLPSAEAAAAAADALTGEGGCAALEAELER